MLSFLSRFGLALILTSTLTAQTRISELTELAVAPANGDLLVIVDVGTPNVTKNITVSNFLSSLPAANLTGDIEEGRMESNWGTAGTSSCATSGGVMFDNGTAVRCDPDFTFDGDVLNLATGATKGLSFGDGDSRIFEVVDDVLRVELGEVAHFQLLSTGASFRANDTIFWRTNLFSTLRASITGSGSDELELAAGGDQTEPSLVVNVNGAVCRDTTDATGDSLCVVRGGAGETGNAFEVQDNAGNVNFGITEDGNTLTETLAINDNTTPSAASDACTVDTIWSDGSHIFFCNASGDIRRVAIATW